MEIEPNLREQWRMIQRRRWIVFAVFSTTTILSYFYARMQIPLYQAQAVVKFEHPGANVAGADTAQWIQENEIQSQIMKLKSSREMAKRVEDRLGAQRRKLAGSLGASRASPDTNMINITAKGTDPALAAELANAMVDVYIEMDKEERSQTARTTVKDILKRRAEVEESLRELEDKRQAYLESHHDSAQDSALASVLMDNENKRKELLKKYTEEHPEVVALDQKIELVKTRLERIPAEKADLMRLDRDIHVNEGIYVNLSSQLEEAQITLDSIPSFVSSIAKAEAPKLPVNNVRANRFMGPLLGLLLGIVAATILESLDISISTIEDIETVIGVPVLGVVPHLGAVKKWETFKAALLRKERLPVEIFRSQLLFNQSPKSPVIEVYHSLRSNIQAQRPKLDRMVLTFTSTGVAEGKTLTSINFCAAAAHAGLKTLLIAADLRRPVVYRIFGIPRTPGLMEILSGKCDWRDTIRGTADFVVGDVDLDKLLAFQALDNFKVMSGWAPNTADVVSLFSSPELPMLISDLRPHFDIVVFDCPPVLLFIDAIKIGAQTDGVVIVYKAGVMARQALRRAKDQLQTGQASILGVILNDMKATDMEPRYGFYYDYGHYYTKREEI